MATSLTLRDPVAFAKAEAEREIGRALDIAHEIYLVRQCATIHYADLMDDVPVGTASKQMLLAWIRDYPNRPGIITLYMRGRPNHFDGGAWMARYFAQFIEFAKGKLTDREFVGSRKKANLFAESFGTKHGGVKPARYWDFGCWRRCTNGTNFAVVKQSMCCS
ncbi:hypothetical protein GCM10025857_68210 [Alicyclobacillus contaminans]|nr:hypothetical protein GCM10025857_68210 [Alicyclobacillus contaminans]